MPDQIIYTLLENNPEFNTQGGSDTDKKKLNRSRFDKGAIRIAGHFVPTKPKGYVVDSDYIRDCYTGKPLSDTIEDVQEAAVASQEQLDSMLEDGKIKADYLPSYVDDIIEGYYYHGAFYLDSEHTQEITPEKGKIYSDISVTPAVDYRWGGSAYVVHHAQANWNQSDATEPDYIKNKPLVLDRSTMITYKSINNKYRIEYRNDAVLNQDTLIVQLRVYNGSVYGSYQEIIFHKAGNDLVSYVLSTKNYIILKNFYTMTYQDEEDYISTTVIPEAQIQADWNQSDTTALDYIKNKPNIPEQNIITKIYSQQMNYDNGVTYTLDYTVTPSDANKTKYVLLNDANTLQPSYQLQPCKIKFLNSTETSIGRIYGHVNGNKILIKVDIVYQSEQQINLLVSAVNINHVTNTNNDRLQHCINQGFLSSKEFYYNTSDSKLLLATSNIALVEIQTTSYTPQP